MAGIFGTDGVRSRINTGAMRAEAIVRLALAAGRWFVDEKQDHTQKPLVVIAKDTRLSGYMIEAALVAGFASIGMDCKLLGPVPTSAVSIMTKRLNAHLGVMISASHNPYHDNGIKLFGPDGFKLDDAIETEISALMQGSIALGEAEEMGRVRRILDSADDYVDYALNSVTDKALLSSMKIVVDCANGAAYRTAPMTLEALGANVIPLFNDPDGLNINQDCGAVHPQKMAKTVQEQGADLGIALDGDADRLIVADATGHIYNGDNVLGAIAASMHVSGALKGPVVGTLMTNLGLERYFAEQGMSFARAKVGDRYILERLKADGGNIGGEGSGHILMPDMCPSGDGLMAALQLISAAKSQDKTLQEALSLFEAVPQKLVNLEHMDKAILQDERIEDQLAKQANYLGDEGRVLIRPSGTEPVIRVMVEALDAGKMQASIDALCKTLQDVNQDYKSQ